MAQNDALSYLGHAHRLGWVGGWHREGGESVGHIPAKNAPTFVWFKLSARVCPEPVLAKSLSLLIVGFKTEVETMRRTQPKNGSRFLVSHRARWTSKPCSYICFMPSALFRMQTFSAIPR